MRVASVAYDTQRSLDVSYPAAFGFARQIPAVVLVGYYSDKESRGGYGVSFREYEPSTDWASLLAAQGIAAVLRDVGQPYFSGRALFSFLCEHGSDLCIDTARLGIFAVSANVETSMQLLTRTDLPCLDGMRTAAFLYGTSYGGDPPAADVDIMLVRAGQDLDKYVGSTERVATLLGGKGFDLTFVDYRDGLHGFDTKQDTERTQEIVEGVLRFFAERL